MKINFGNISDKNYAYTLIIPAGCMVNKTFGIRFRDLTPAEQRALLCKLLVDEIMPDTLYSINYEQHKDGRFHIHGHIKGSCSECILSMQRQINIRLGYKSDNKKIFYYKIEYNKAGWDTYCHKDILKHCELPEESPLQGAPND